jgi:hypothetical protein
MNKNATDPTGESYFLIWVWTSIFFQTVDVVHELPNSTSNINGPFNAQYHFENKLKKQNDASMYF